MSSESSAEPHLGLAAAKALIIAHHYTHSWPSGKSVVFTFESAVIVFSIPANCMVSRWLVGVPNRVWELTRLWAPDGHRKNLLTQAISHAVREFHKLQLADALISYADPNVGHKGGVYRAASWVYLGQSEESRAYRGPGGQILSRRKFHSGPNGMTKAQILAKGFSQLSLPGKERFARALTRAGKRGIANRWRIISAEQLRSRSTRRIPGKIPVDRQSTLGYSTHMVETGLTETERRR